MNLPPHGPEPSLIPSIYYNCHGDILLLLNYTTHISMLHPQNTNMSQHIASHASLVDVGLGVWTVVMNWCWYQYQYWP